MEGEGFKVLRFWNNDIVDNGEAVLNSIYAAMYGSVDAEAIRFKHQRHTPIKDHPTPVRMAHRPSPSRGG